MTLLNKKIIAFAIVTSGLLVSFFILKSPPPQRTDTTFLTTKSNNPNLDFKTASLVPSKTPNLKFPSPPQNTNLTDKLGQAFIQAIIGPSSKSVLSSDGVTDIIVPSQESVSKILQEQLSQGLSFSQFDRNDIRVSNKTSPADQLAYLETLNYLSKKNFANLKNNFVDMLDEWALKQNNEPLKEYLSRIPEQVDDLLSLTVPSTLADFHLRNLNLWQKKLSVFTALINMNDDPLKTYLAVQEMPTIVDESLALQDFVEKKYEELKG